MRNGEVAKALLVVEAWREGREYGGYLASEQVAWCLANRVRRGMGSWMDVLANADKNKATAPAERAFPNLWDADFMMLCSKVDGIYDNMGSDLAQGGIFYADTSKEISEWFKSDVIRNPAMTRLVQMNSFCIWG